MDVKIFVEGPADKRFIEQYCKYLFDKDIPVKDCGGYNKIKEQAFINEFLKNSDAGGVNLVIFDADEDYENRRKELEKIKNDKNLQFELFLFPNNNDSGALETLLERIINPVNQGVLDCWYTYEAELKKLSIPWKTPQTPTIPASKTKIYGYLEALTGTTKREKETIKEVNRNYCDRNLWNLESENLEKLKLFLEKNIGRV